MGSSQSIHVPGGGTEGKKHKQPRKLQTVSMSPNVLRANHMHTRTHTDTA